MVTIKRENWKGKLRYVARDERGRILSHVKATRKTNKAKLEKQFKTTKSFSKDITRRKLNNVYEITEKKPRSIPKNRPANYFIRIKFSTGEVVTVKSRRVTSVGQLKRAKAQAEENLTGKIGQLFGQGDFYDEDLGEKILRTRTYTREEGVVRYANA